MAEVAELVLGDLLVDLEVDAVVLERGEHVRRVRRGESQKAHVDDERALALQHRKLFADVAGDGHVVGDRVGVLVGGLQVQAREQTR